MAAIVVVVVAAVVVVVADVSAASLISFSFHLAVLRTLGYCSPMLFALFAIVVIVALVVVD